MINSLSPATWKACTQELSTIWSAIHFLSKYTQNNPIRRKFVIRAPIFFLTHVFLFNAPFFPANTGCSNGHSLHTYFRYPVCSMIIGEDSFCGLFGRAHKPSHNMEALYR